MTEPPTRKSTELLIEFLTTLNEDGADAAYTRIKEYPDGYVEGLLVYVHNLAQALAIELDSRLLKEVGV